MKLKIGIKSSKSDKLFPKRHLSKIIIFSKKLVVHFAGFYFTCLSCAIWLDMHENEQLPGSNYSQFTPVGVQCISCAKELTAHYSNLAHHFTFFVLMMQLGSH